MQLRSVHFSIRLQSYAAAGLMLAGLSVLAACGGSSNNGKTPVSKVKHRVFASVQFPSSGLPSGFIEVIDADKDQAVTTILLGGTPGLMVETADKSKTLIADTVANLISVADNVKENASTLIQLPGVPSSYVVLPDNNTGYAAIRNSNEVSVFDISKVAVSTNITVTLPQRLVLSHNGKKLLVFSDVSNLQGDEANSFSVIDTAANTATTVTDSTLLDRPVSAVFSSDDTKAYILSCGAECGGVNARVTVLDMSSNTLGTSVQVPAATVGLLNGSTLYVAGTDGSSGALSLVDPGTLAVTAGPAISDGYHSVMTLASNNKLFIGATTCTSACLSIYDTSAKSVTNDPTPGDVTAAQPINGRNVVYVMQGGELVIFDTTTSKPQAKQLDIVGRGIDVKAIDNP
jgi:hypothetical protein